MSLEIRKYGPVYISAGIAISGVLWFLRPLPAVRGEDLCEISAAATERPAVAYLTGTNQPAWASNMVFSSVGWAPLYAAMKAAKQTATAVDYGVSLVADYPGDAYDFEKVFWLDPADAAPADGDYIAISVGAQRWLLSAETNYYLNNDGDIRSHIDRIWMLADSTTATAYEKLNTTATRTPNASLRFLPGVSQTNLPIVTQLYGFDSPGTHWSYSWTNNVRTNSWWRQIGTNIYLYSCEALNPERAAIAIEYGSGYQVLTNTLDFPYFEWNIFKKTALLETSGTNWTGAVACSITSEGRSNGWFVVADVPAGVPPATTYDYGTYTAKRIFEVTSGSSVSFDVFPYPLTPGQTRTIYFSGLGCSVSPASLTWSTTYSKRTVTATLSSGAGVVKMSEGGQPDGYVAIIAGASSAWTVNSAKSSAAVGSTVAVSIKPTSPWTNTTVIARRQAVSMNDLDESRTVLGDLKRTIYICMPGDLIVSNAMVYAGTVQDNETLTDQYGAAPDTGGYDFMCTLAASDFETSADEDFPDYLGSLANQTYTFARYSMEGWANTYEWFDGVDLRYNHSKGASLDYESRHWQGCKVPYPSDWACASGYVAKVSIYACVAAGSTPYHYVGIGWGTNELSARLTFLYGGRQGLSTNTFGLFKSPVLPGSPLTNDAAYTAQESDSILSALYTEPSSWKLSPLGTWDSPALVPRFDMGARRLPPPISDTADWREWVTDDAEGNYHQHDWDWRYEQSVYLRAIVVVVDWNFRHLNAGTPFVPENWTPAWMTSNTNTPAK